MLQDNELDKRQARDVNHENRRVDQPLGVGVTLLAFLLIVLFGAAIASWVTTGPSTPNVGTQSSQTTDAVRARTPPETAPNPPPTSPAKG
jgi:hypothetical protein